MDNKKKTALKKLECVRFFLREPELRRFQEYRFSVEEENISLDEDEGIGTELNPSTDSVEIKNNKAITNHGATNLEVMVSCKQHVHKMGKCLFTL